MMKKVICLLLALALALGMAGGSLAETATERLMTDWVTLLAMQDDLLTQESYAYQAILALQAEPTWENLVRARAAACYTCALAAHYAQTEAVQTMTPEDYDALTAQGMDVSSLQAEFAEYNSVALPELQNVTAPAWNGYYKAELMEMAFDRYSLASLAAAAQANVRWNDSSLRYLYLVTNYLLLELPEADAKRLDELARLNAPGAMGMYDAAFSSVNDVQNEMNSVIKQMEEALLDSEKATSLAQADLDAAQSRADGGETAVAPENCLTLEGLPTTLPWPSFWDSETSEITYYWRDEAGTLTSPTRRMTMETIPNCMAADIPGVALADYQAYVQRLQALGFTPKEATDTAALFTLNGGITLLLQWKDGGAQISVRGGQLCFAPDWYASALAR